FASGLLAHVKPPDPALRGALVERKASTLGVSLAPEVASYLAEEWCANVRELEGALTRVEAYATLSGRTIDLALVREALGSSPVVHALAAIERRLEKDATLRDAVSMLRARLRA